MPQPPDRRLDPRPQTRPHAAEAAGAGYFGCGAVFGTTSKGGLERERIGTERLREVVQAVSIPVVGIGGIQPANVDRVAATGAAGVAVIGAVMGVRNVEADVRRLLGGVRRIVDRAREGFLVRFWLRAASIR